MFARWPLRWSTVTALALSGALVASCAHSGSSKKHKDEDEDVSSSSGGKQLEDPDHPGAMTTKKGEILPSVTFGDGAEENWKLGEAAFADDDYLAAQRYYSYIRSKYPYSQYAALADLRIGDCQYARGRYIEAIDSYQNFVRLHPTHERVPYALYRSGLSRYRQIPGDWFLMPPSEEKEQTAVHEAERSLRDYCDRFPNDENIAEGRKLLTDVRKRLVAHERYVADFYRRIGKDRAYVGRLEVIRRDFGDVALDDALLFEIASVYVRLGQGDDARSTVKELEQKFPGSPKLAEARAMLATLAPTPVPASKTSTAAHAG